MIEVRSLTERGQFEEVVRLQKTIWGFDDIDLLPVRLFVVASHIGGQVLAAYHSDRMIGFCVAIPGVKPGGQVYLHSNMLGVVSEYHDRGVGRALKLFQRTEALARSIQLIEWTFDPLQIKNAYFNIERLGAVIRRYAENQYGTTTSPLHGGLPTDRCIAEWWLASERVESVLSGRPVDRRVEARIEVPADIETTRKTDPGKAREIQQRVREQFQRFFGEGLAVTGFERTPEAGCYLLGPWQ